MAKTAETYHVPVLLRESVEGLNIRPGGVYVDVTFGGGGHSREIFSRLSGNARLFSFDQDADAEVNSGVGCWHSGDGCWVMGDNEKLSSNGQEVGSGDGRLVLGDDEMTAEKPAINTHQPSPITQSPTPNTRIPSPECQHPSPKFTFIRSNFRYLKNWMRYYGVEQIDGLLADLGVSSHHFDDETRGFSFRFDAPLDMRMNKRAGMTAADIVNTYDEEALAAVFYLYGELKNSRRIAAALAKARQQQPIATTQDFMNAVESLFRREREKKDMAKLFQALRIEVNHELSALKEMLGAATELLAPGGRLSVITYHSLEDRIVKNFMRAGNAEGKISQDFFGRVETPFSLVNSKVIVAGTDEVERNPRSRSAKLRIAEKK